jgi:LCP family protein required for cell wall assembly
MGERSDTVMVMRVDPANRRAAVLSFPRDLWVQIANSGRKSRINSAYVKDDPRNLIATIVLNFQVGIDHFIQVDFCAFKRLVEAVDGVSVPFTFAARDGNTGLNVPQAGCFKFDGDHALAYVRSRHYEYLDDDGRWKEDPASDLGRISRQQDFIRRALDAALAKGVYNPSVARGVIDIATQSIVVDEGLTPAKMLEFFGVLRDFDPGTISTYQIEATPQNISGNAVLVPQLEGKNMQSILRIFQGIAPLASAPEQVFETTTTSVAGGETTDPSASTSTSTSTSSPATTVPSVTSTTVFVEGPDENVKGIVPPDTRC